MTLLDHFEKRGEHLGKVATSSMQRREFVKAGLAAGMGTLLPRRVAAADAEGEGDLKVALLGAGLQGRVLLTAALNLPNLRFQAVCDIWEYSRRTARYLLARYGHPANEYADYREMLEKEPDLDAVLVATPDFLHAPQTIACLGAGCHVYCERPMASTLAEAQAMERVMRDSGRLLQIGHQHRSNPRYVHVRQRLLGEANLLGRVLHARGQWCQPLYDDFGWPQRFAMPEADLQAYGYAGMHQLRNWRAFRKFSAGPFAELGGPHLDAIGWLLDAQPQAVTAVASADYDPARQWPDHVIALVAYQSPAGPLRGEYQVLTTTSGDGIRSYQHLMGTEGSIRMSENPRWTAIFREPHAADWQAAVSAGILKQAAASQPPTSAEEHVRETGVVVPYQLPIELDQPMHQPHLENFFAAIRGQTPLACPADAALPGEALLHKVQEALTAGATLSCQADAQP